MLKCVYAFGLPACLSAFACSNFHEYSLNVLKLLYDIQVNNRTFRIESGECKSHYLFTVTHISIPIHHDQWKNTFNSAL